MYTYEGFVFFSFIVVDPEAREISNFGPIYNYGIVWIRIQN